MSACLLNRGVASARELLEWSKGNAVQGDWSLDVLAGRFVELSGGAASAAVSVSAALILEAQRRGELTVWIGRRDATFYPPDFAASGIDLEALPVVHVGDMAQALRAADTLLRSGGFAVMVLDLGAEARLPFAIQTRLVGLAKRHNTVLLAITGSGGQSGTPLVSLRVESSHCRGGHNRFVCELHAVKDKRRAPGWSSMEIRRGPDGLC